MDEQEVKKIIEEFKETYPKDFFKILDKNNEECYSKDICLESGLSSARVAVLLKKMEAKDLIKKSDSKDDGSFTIIRLTSNGRKEIEKMRNESLKRANKVIEKVGIEEAIKE